MVRCVVAIWYHEKRYAPEVNHEEILKHMKEVQR